MHTKAYTNFEDYLEANGMGDGIPLNDTILVENAYLVTNLDISNLNIADLTGIEGFNWVNSVIISGGYWASLL